MGFPFCTPLDAGARAFFGGRWARVVYEFGMCSWSVAAQLISNQQVIPKTLLSRLPDRFCQREIALLLRTTCCEPLGVAHSQRIEGCKTLVSVLGKNLKARRIVPAFVANGDNASDDSLKPALCGASREGLRCIFQCRALAQID